MVAACSWEITLTGSRRMGYAVYGVRWADYRSRMETIECPGVSGRIGRHLLSATADVGNEFGPVRPW
jgi:hypothetical protein